MVQRVKKEKKCGEMQQRSHLFDEPYNIEREKARMKIGPVLSDGIFFAS